MPDECQHALPSQPRQNNVVKNDRESVWRLRDDIPHVGSSPFPKTFFQAPAQRVHTESQRGDLESPLPSRALLHASLQAFDQSANQTPSLPSAEGIQSPWAH